MNTSVRKVSERYLKRATEDADVEPGQEVRAERLIDLINLAVCFDVYAELLESKKTTSSPLLTKGTVLLKRYAAELNAGLQAHLAPLAERPDSSSLHALFARALRSGGVLIQIRQQAKLFRALLPWLKIRTAVFNGIFTGRSARPARTLASIYEESVPATLLNQAAAVAPVSGLSATRKWIENVAAEAGAPLKPVEGVLADTQVAMALGQDLASVEQQIIATPANTPAAADLQAQRVRTLDEIQKVADNSADPSAVVSAVAAARPTHQYATDIGKKLGHTPEQEVAMMARGKVLIAATAGSGKTRVLASKVVYHINELGMDPQSILATTFTNKAAAELIARVKKFGGIIENTSGFGTTHSICGKLLNTRATQYRRENYIGKKEGWKQVTLLRLAMEQVKMKGAASPPPKPRGFWEGAAVADQPMVDPDFSGAIQDTIGYFQWAAQNWGKPWPAGNRPGNPKAAAWAAEMVLFLRDINRKSPNQLTDQQKRLLNELFSKVKGRTTVNYRIKSAGADPAAPTPRKRQSKMDQYEFAKVSARQWFNLGLKLTRQVKSAEVPIPLGEFKNALAIMKGRGMSPSEAWARGVVEEGEVVYEPESEFAAVYGAYEWLKGAQGEPEFRNTGDMDDILIDTVTALVSNPNIRGQLQRQYKVLIVDEAQDLNPVQHLIFGLMAGYLDPSNLRPWPDKHMTADTFAFVGDDSQSIYEFRGANPGEFIDKSDLVSGGEFATKSLGTNFRSGSAIVNAAQKLIQHNKKRIPLVCRANEDKNGTGKIVARSVESTEEAAVNVADEVSSMVDSGEVSKYDSKEMRGGYASFGIALRSNAEAYTYGLELLKKGVPFKSNANFFSDPNTKALIGWMTLAENGLDGSPELLEDAIQDATRAPYSKMGPAFINAMNDKATGSWARWLVDNGAKRLYSRQEMVDAGNHFIANIQTVASLTGSPTQILEKILQLKGLDGETMEQSMIHSVEENEDLMASLEAEAEDGVVTPEMVRDQAMAPIAPLVGLMKGKEDLGAAMGYVRKLRNVNAKISSKDTDEEIDRDAVTIGTMHSWKGLEIPTMFIPVVGGKFPRITTSPRLLASERRLAYVAITRAEQKAILFDIPHPKLTDNGRPIRSQFFNEACIPHEGSHANKVTPGKTASMEWREVPHTMFEASKWDNDDECSAAMMKINELELAHSWGC